MKLSVLALLPLIALGALTLGGCGTRLTDLLAVDGIRGTDVCGEIGLETCRTRAGYLEAGDFSVPAPGILTSASLADGYLFRATEDGPARIGMASAQVDSLLSVYLVRPDESLELLGEDDDAGFQQNAVVRFPLEKGQEYLVVATSWGLDLGRYRLIYSENLLMADDSPALIASLLPTRKVAVAKTAERER